MSLQQYYVGLRKAYERDARAYLQDLLMDYVLLPAVDFESIYKYKHFMSRLRNSLDRGSKLTYKEQLVYDHFVKRKRDLNFLKGLYKNLNNKHLLQRKYTIYINNFTKRLLYGDTLTLFEVFIKDILWMKVCKKNYKYDITRLDINRLTKTYWEHLKWALVQDTVPVIYQNVLKRIQMKYDNKERYKLTKRERVLTLFCKW